MAAIYKLIGRLVVQAVRIRYRRQIRIAMVAGVAAVLAGGFLAATRQPPEG